MVFTSGALDARLLSYSRELVRDAFKALSDSEQIAQAQRARDEVAATQSERTRSWPA